MEAEQFLRVWERVHPSEAPAMTQTRPARSAELLQKRETLTALYGRLAASAPACRTAAGEGRQLGMKQLPALRAACVLAGERVRREFVPLCPGTVSLLRELIGREREFSALCRGTEREAWSKDAERMALRLQELLAAALR